MRAGKLRHKVQLWRNVIIKDPKGGQKITRVEIFKRVWCELKDMNAFEMFQNAQRKHDVTHKAIFRALAIPTLKPKDGIQFKGRRMTVESIKDRDERGIEKKVKLRELEGSDTTISTNQIFNSNGDPIFNSSGGLVFNTG